MKQIISVVAFQLILVYSYAHPNITYPVGEETFASGQVINIQWEILIPHDLLNWDLFFSKDDGANWDTIQIDILPDQLEYAWTIPEINTTQGKIRIVMDNSDVNYESIIGNFEIKSGINLGNALFIPDTMTGSNIDLNFQVGQVEFYEGLPTNTFGYNQDYLGPTLILKKGNNVTLNVTNNLSETTTLHWHGLHVAPENDGGPHTTIEAGTTWSPSFTVLDQAATYWYHPHLHEQTEQQVTKGGAGFIIVRDDAEAQLEIPRTYGLDDFPVVIQSRAFDANKQFLTKTAADNVILTNGTLDAYLDVPAQIVRLRLLNGSTERVYHLGFQNNLSFYQIASDGGLLEAPVALTRLRLVPGERAEVLVDLSLQQGNSINLMSFGSELPSGIYGATNPSVMPFGSIPGYQDNLLNGNDFNILQLNVVGQTDNPLTTIPTELVPLRPYSENDVNATRSLTFNPVQMGPTNMLIGPFEINNASFNLDLINYEIPLNNIEIWDIFNMTAIAHPFHIHDVQFFILDINGNPPPQNMKGRKDVVLVPPMGGRVRLITKFEDFASDNVPYMYHCHMLSHEDEGMMGQFLVIDNTTSVEKNRNEIISIFPNPTMDRVTIQGIKPSTIRLFNGSGQLLEQRRSRSGHELFDMGECTSGIYFFKIITTYYSQTFKIVKN